MSDRRYQVFISSTLEDLIDERQKIWQTLVSLNYLVAGMETFPATAGSQLEYISRQILASDYMILVLAGRYGSVDDEGVSYTEREFDMACQLNVPVLVFPHRKPDNIVSAKCDHDANLRHKLDSLKVRARAGRMSSSWESADELALAVLQSVQNAQLDKPRPGWMRGDIALDGSGVAELEALRRERLELQEQLRRKTEFSEDPIERSALTKPYRTNYTTNKGGVFAAKQAKVNLAGILKQTALTEEPSRDAIEEALRGAISVVTDDDYEDVAVDWETVDRALLRFIDLKIISLKKAGSRIQTAFGPQWIAAQTLVKRGDVSSKVET